MLRFLFIALAFLAFSQHQTAFAQQLWDKPGKAVDLTEEQSKAVADLSEALGKVERWNAAERCYATANGKCPDTELADMSQKENVLAFVADAKNCATLSRTAGKAGVPSTQPIEFDTHHEPEFESPMSLRNTEHFCNAFRGYAERHAAFFDRSIQGSLFSDYKPQALSQEVGTSMSRLTRWQAIYECYEKSDKCEEQPDIREIGTINSWVHDAEGCLADIKHAREAEASDDQPIEFVANSLALQSPQTLVDIEAYCQTGLEDAKNVLEKANATVAQNPPAAENDGTGVASAQAATPSSALTPEQEKILGNLFQNAPQIVAAIDAHQNPNSTNHDDLKQATIVKFWADNAKECQDLVASALKAGVPEDYPFEYPVYDSGLKSPMPLATYGKEVCGKARELSDATVAQKEGKENAKLAPYLEVLKGDRLRLFKEHKLLDRLIQGPGGNELTTPEDFVSSPAWYTTVEDDSAAAGPRWVIGGWQFNGDTVLRNYTDSGWGRTPPSDAFPEVDGGAPGSNAGSGGFFGTISWLFWTIVRLAVLAALGLALYTYFGWNIPQVEKIIDKAPMIRPYLAKIPRRQPKN